METNSDTFWQKRNILFLLIFLFSFLPTPEAGLFDCTSAVWGDWGAWSVCPSTATGLDPTVVTKRSRTCNKSPFYCLTAISCDGDMSQTMVCGTTTTKEHYSTIVFGTTAFDETTTVDDVTTTDASATTRADTTTKESTDAATTTKDSVTTADATTAAITTEESAVTSDAVTSAGVNTAAATTEESVVTSASVTSGDVTTEESAGTSAAVTSVRDATTDASASSPSNADKTTIDFTFASNPTDDYDETTVPIDQPTAPYDECAPPVTTVSTMSPGTLGTLFPGGGGNGGLDPYTFATETPTPMPGVTRSPACKTTPILTTTIPFKTCTMIAVSSTTPMITSTTEQMDVTSTTSSVVSTTLDNVSTPATEESTTAETSRSSTEAAASSEEPSASSTEDSVSSVEPAVSTQPSGSSTEASASSEEPGESTEQPASSTNSGESTDASATSEEPSGSSTESGASTEASVSSESPSGSSEEPGASTDASASSETLNSESSTESIVTTPEVIIPTTTSSTWTTCNDCSQINVQLFNGVPYEDASSVLNRYSASGCYYVQFFCRPIEIGDISPVSTILSGNTSYLGAPLSANLACRDKKWVLLSSTNPLAASVTSLGCVYVKATTTTRKPTTIPGIDPSNPCMNCSNLVVSQSVYPEGVTYLDHTLGACLSVEAHCVPIQGGKEVELMYNNKGILAGGSTVNRTFTCNKNSKWIDSTTNSVISNISCIMPKATTTTPIIASTLPDIPSTEGGSPTKDSSKPPTVRTTPDVIPPEEETTPSAFITTDSQQISTVEEMPSTDGSVVTIPVTLDEDSTTTLPSICNNCPALEPLAMTKAGSYHGMLVLWHYRLNGCYRVSISCQGTVSESDTATLYYNPNGIVMNGVGEQEMDVVCNNGNYMYNGKAISTVSCLASTTAVVPVTTLPPLTTPAPGDDCSGCNRLPVIILPTTSTYTNGLLKATTAYLNCMSVQLTCYGVSGSEQVALIYEDAPLATGTGMANLTLTCNTAGTWITAGLQTVESISCGYIPLLLTTTPIPTACGSCSNMESAEALLQTGTYDGMIVLYNYFDSSHCKKVDVSCQGTTATENSTLIFEPIGPVLTGITIHEITLNCSSDGKWKYQGTVITSVSCIVSQPNGVVIPATTDIVSTTTTTLNPTVPMCAQCSRLTAGVVSSIDNSLVNGVTTMSFGTVNSCSTVNVVCSGNTQNERVTLLAATTSLISGVGKVNFNFTCNSAASWMTAAGTIVDSVACGRYNLTTSSSPVTTPRTSSASTTTTTPVSQCSKCANLMAKAVNPTDGSYDGMIVLNHYTDTTGCRKVDVSCGPTLNTENATIIFGATVVATGATTHSFSLSCNPTANWIYDSTSVSTVSCVISTASGGVTVAPSTPTTPKVIDDSSTACSQCGKAPIVSVGSGSTYLNGFTTVVQSTDSSGCSLLNIKCQGTATNGAVALLSSGMPLASSYGSVSTNLTCNSQYQWIARTGSVVTSLACGHKTGAATVSPITTLAPTGQCATCSNMIAVSMAAVATSGMDGMVVMDHSIDPLTRCRVVTVTCTPTTSTENATLYFGQTVQETGMSSHSLDLQCNANAQWNYGGTVVSTVGCIVSTGNGQAATTQSTQAPVTNPSNNLCSQCTRIPVVSSSNFIDGITTLITSINSFGCLTATMSCQTLSSNLIAAIVANNDMFLETALGTTNYTDFQCNSQGQWTTNSLVINNLACVVHSSPSNDVTTRLPSTTTTTISSLCNSCPNIEPTPMGNGAYYDGMIVINHYKDRKTLCRKASIDCMTTMDYETAELLLDSEVINIGSGVGVNLECSASGTWQYDGSNYSSTSCLVANSSSSLPSSGTTGKRKKRQAGTGLTACQSCGFLPMTSLYSFYPYMNGYSTISMDSSSTCMTATASCEGISSTNGVAWIASGTVLSSGIGMVNMTFTCNSLSSWQTSSGSVFSSLSCGRQTATTTVAPTTVASQALNCPNLVAAPLSATQLQTDESNGQLILDHFVNTTMMVREVTITCYGNSATDNTTISFNGGSRTMSGTGQIQLTMTCDSSGQWMRNGIGVQTVACVVVSPPGSTIPLTTTIPTTPTTSAGSSPNTNCARNVMLTIPSGYNAGYLSMNTVSTETSLQLVMSCSAPTGISESMLLSADGSLSRAGTTMTNMTLTCNSLSQWVVSSASGNGISVGTVITTIACVVAVSPTTTLVPATVPAGCRACTNLPAIGLASYQLDSNERNGQFILDHITTTNACRVVYLSCAGSSASENSTILFNGGTETMSNQGITSTVLTCTSSSTWDWYGSSISYASCKVADRALTTTTVPPTALTTTAYVLPGDTGLQCSRWALVNPLISGDAGAYLVLDTNIVNGGLSTTLSCAAPDNSGTAVLTNGDGSLLGQSSNGLINMTLTCNSGGQWVLTAISASTTGTSAALGTVVNGMKCGEVPVATTTLTTPTTTTISTSTTASGACRQCPNMQALALTSSQLVSGATNGQLLLSHTIDPSTSCRIVVIKCRGENTNQNATIFFNSNSQTLSAMYGQVSTSMACTPSNIWSRNSVQITGVACMITSVIGATSTSPAPITTLPPSSTTQSASGPAASCSTSFNNGVTAPGYTSGFMTIDTTTSGGIMTAVVNCAAPVTTQTAALLGSSNQQLNSGVGSTNMTLTCNGNSQWVTTSGTVVSSLSCGTVAAATTTLAATTASTAATGDCSTATWNTWQAWSDCTDTCGSCGSQQRFRSCNKPFDSCTCPGSAYEKEYCNLAVCKFPRTSCCTGFTPRSSGGTFVCMQ